MNPLIFTPASQLVGMLRDRTLSATELLHAYLDQIERHNPQLNAICTLDVERAKHQAHQADQALAKGENWGPLHGLPMTVKDIFETEGLRTTAGYPPLRDYVPTQDATAVARLKAAGAIILGKSNCAQMASDYQSTNDLFPPVNNPWNLDYTAGGSSGGSAAAIAAGFTPLELGNDFGGSMRQPAHFCGVYSFKPTDRRLSTRGMIPEYPGVPKCIRQILTAGGFGRSVADLQLCFSVLAGPDPRQPDVPPVPLEPSSDKAVGELRIAWMARWPDIPTTQETQTAIQAAAQALAQAGATVQAWHPPLDLANLFQTFSRVAAYNNGLAAPWSRALAARALPMMWREATQGDPQLRRLFNISHLMPPLLNPTLKNYFAALTDRDRIIATMDQALEPWDAWICPVAVTPAFTHRPTGQAIDVAGHSVPYFLASGAYTMPTALTGHPVVVIPIGQTAAGLPIGLQIVGQRWQEMELFAIATEIDRVVGNYNIPPTYQ